MANISILGSGAFGVALSVLLDRNSHKVKVWDISEPLIKGINKTRTHKNLENEKISESIIYSNDLEFVLDGSEYILIALPSAVIRQNLKNIKKYYNNQVIINVAKGIEDTSLALINEQVKEELGTDRFVVMSGPSYAIEIARGLATSAVVACTDIELAKDVRDLLMNSFLRLYVSDDVVGVELGGAAKNVIAIAAGIADGLGYGDNAKAALITRGIAEISRLGVAMGGRLETFFGLSGIGDLIVTCSGAHSRNRACGQLLAKGYSLEEAQKQIGMVVEGVFSARSVRDLARKYNVEMPLVNEVCNILFEGKDAKIVVDELMNRNKNVEFYKS